MPCRRKLYLQTKNCLKNFELHLLLSWTATSLLRFRSQRISVSSVVDLLLLLIACHHNANIVFSSCHFFSKSMTNVRFEH